MNLDVRRVKSTGFLLWTISEHQFGDAVMAGFAISCFGTSPFEAGSPSELRKAVGLCLRSPIPGNRPFGLG